MSDRSDVRGCDLSVSSCIGAVQMLYRIFFFFFFLMSLQLSLSLYMYTLYVQPVCPHAACLCGCKLPSNSLKGIHDQGRALMKAYRSAAHLSLFSSPAFPFYLPSFGQCGCVRAGFWRRKTVTRWTPSRMAGGFVCKTSRSDGC